MLRRPRLAQGTLFDRIGRNRHQRLPHAGPFAGLLLAAGAWLELGACEELANECFPEERDLLINFIKHDREAQLRGKHHELKRVVVQLAQRRLELERQRQAAHGRLARRRVAVVGGGGGAGGAIRDAVVVLVLSTLGEPLDLDHHLLAREILLVALLEVERAVVKRLGPILLVHLLPSLGELLPQRAPLLVLLLQTLDDQADSGRGALLE
mmetsp:Transcript_8500/g.19904  ORF Transcript_8500/g.19904 Transcript_8500/m.19904 type:complete len:210 (+) Transcript_8500:1306-1935(+)